MIYSLHLLQFRFRKPQQSGTITKHMYGHLIWEMCRRELAANLSPSCSSQWAKLWAFCVGGWMEGRNIFPLFDRYLQIWRYDASLFRGPYSVLHSPSNQSVSLNIYCSRCPLTRNNILAPRSSTFRSDADWRTDGVFHHIIIIIINVQFVLVCVLLRQTFALEADSCVGVKNNFRYIFNHHETKRGRQLNNSSLNYGH